MEKVILEVLDERGKQGMFPNEFFAKVLNFLWGKTYVPLEELEKYTWSIKEVLTKEGNYVHPTHAIDWCLMGGDIWKLEHKKDIYYALDLEFAAKVLKKALKEEAQSAIDPFVKGVAGLSLDLLELTEELSKDFKDIFSEEETKKEDKGCCCSDKEEVPMSEERKKEIEIAEAQMKIANEMAAYLVSRSKIHNNLISNFTIDPNTLEPKGLEEGHEVHAIDKDKHLSKIFFVLTGIYDDNGYMDNSSIKAYWGFGDQMFELNIIGLLESVPPAAYFVRIEGEKWNYFPGKEFGKKDYKIGLTSIKKQVPRKR